MGSPENIGKHIPSELSISFSGLDKVLNQAISYQVQARELRPSIHSDADMFVSDEELADRRILEEQFDITTEVLDQVVPLSSGSWADVVFDLSKDQDARVD